MGKRKGRKEAAAAAAKEPQIPAAAADEIDENGDEEEEKGSGFFACYLLTSLSPRFKGHTYIGFVSILFRFDRRSCSFDSVLCEFVWAAAGIL